MAQHAEDPSGVDSRGVEMPQPTVDPFVIALGIALLGAGLATNYVLSFIGFILFVYGLVGWIRDLLPERGHLHEPLVEPSLRPQPIAARPGTVQQLIPGAVGYRFQLPLTVHPISAGIKGGILGGLVMPIPALIYGVLSGHGIWFPTNLLAGMVVPIVDDMSVARMEQFNFVYLVVAIVIHIVFSVGFGLLYGVVLPTLPKIPGGPLVWGGLLMPLVWTGASHAAMGVVNPAMADHVNWPWFLLSQFIYGITMAIVVYRSEQVPVPPVGHPAPERGR